MSELQIASTGAPLCVGVSACLLGQNTRHDGGNRLDPVIVEIIGAVAQIVPVCPEMEIGMGSPRPPIRLVDGHDGLRAIGVDDPALDVTDALDGVGRGHIGLGGLVLKGRSPSCGTGNTDVFSYDGRIVSPAGYGIFARSVMKTAPLLPVEDETALHDRTRRDVFLLRLFVYDCWTHMPDQGGATFVWFIGETGFAVNALDAQARQKLESITAHVRKDSEPIACVEYASALLSGLRSAPPDGPVHSAADIAVSLLSKRRRASGP